MEFIPDNLSVHSSLGFGLPCLIIVGDLTFPPKPVNTSFPVAADFTTSYSVISTFICSSLIISGVKIPDFAAGGFPLTCSPHSFPPRGVTSSSKLNLFDPDGHRRILIYRKQHTRCLLTLLHI